MGVPGTLAGWQEALARYGTMEPVRPCCNPAIEIAENGFEVTQTFPRPGGKQPGSASPPLRPPPSFISPNGEVPEVGSTFTNPDLAATFRLIADEGINALYRGPIGEDLVEAVRNPPTVENPPFEVRAQEMTMADLDAYDVPMREPVSS